ncbi:MAG: hypothetical protein DVB23_001706 [Verrucomicrobia bacterium]|jgi:hypothetical protein|nr:MAG: hypothetical protein DVB23_001706 [Verrucomicrobiota bacterium]
MDAELQELLPSLGVTVSFAICLMFVARQEEGYRWWKALLIVFCGALTGIVSELAIQSAGSPILQTVLAVLSLVAVVAAIALPGKFWLLMSWRDAILVGIGYVLAQAAVSVALIYLQDHAF